MNTNALANVVNTYLLTKSTRVYRNSAPASPTYPYVVYTVTGSINQYPSEDYTVYIDIYENADTSVIAMENLADAIDMNLNMKVFNDSTLNAHFTQDSRQFVSNTELAGKKMISLSYTARTYFK